MFKMSALHNFKRSVKIGLARLRIVDPFRRLFEDVEFETTAYCNRKCTYCPVSMHERPGDENGTYMREETLENLLSSLREISFGGRVAPHLYGEPLSDSRLVKWMAKVRNALPKCTIRVVTNGDYLTQNKYKELIEAGVTYFDLSKHSSHWPIELETLLSSMSEEEKSKRLRIRDYYSDNKNKQVMLNTRGGEVKLRVKKEHPVWCGYVIYPVINTFGDVVLCCNDYHSEHKFGNINQRSLLDIWLDPKNIKLRRRIFQNYFDLPICQKCYM